jgi:hypothetical protein
LAKISFSKEDLSGNVYPDGLYELRLEGFEPEYSKAKTSINLNPVLKIVNHATLNGKRVFDNLNSGASWIIESFCHAFGLPLTPNVNGGGDMPGDFNGLEALDTNPDGVQYVGPLTGCVAKALLKTTSYNGKENSKVDQWLCSVPNCNTKHASGLAR